MRTALCNLFVASAVVATSLGLFATARGAKPAGYYTEEGLRRLAVAGMTTNDILMCYGLPDDIAEGKAGWRLWSYYRSDCGIAQFADGDVMGFGGGGGRVYKRKYCSRGEEETKQRSASRAEGKEKRRAWLATDVPVGIFV